MDLNTLIAECTAYDYKEALEEKKPKSWLKSVSAFANTMGGNVLNTLSGGCIADDFSGILPKFLYSEINTPHHSKGRGL